MKVLKANQEIYEAINGFQNGVHRLEFIKDADDNWIVNLEVKECAAFASVMDEINKLEEIEYNPIIEVENA